MPRAAIAFGSNLGDRATNIAQALRSIGRFCTVQRTSSLYESPPAYVTEQPPFLNSVCHVETSLAPRELLAKQCKVCIHEYMSSHVANALFILVHEP